MTQTEISQYSAAIQNWVTNQKVTLEAWQVADLAKYLHKQNPIMALRFIRQAYDATLDDAKTIMDSIVRVGY